jgi:Rps23 Pro-64 3,4-dihydroxylase Tpa1-like proline 4-hydroxylase
MSDLTGIPDLLPDVNMFGGGTHENRHGQQLDAHVDFNYDPKTKLHRRLNLLVYLNKEWDESWGGSIELHSNPRKPDENTIASFTPDFNRAVIFETNEYSWHGFPRINLPADKRHLSRKAFPYIFTARAGPSTRSSPSMGPSTFRGRCHRISDRDMS